MSINEIFYLKEMLSAVQVFNPAFWELLNRTFDITIQSMLQ